MEHGTELLEGEEMVSVHKGYLFAVIRAAQGWSEYVRNPDGYPNGDALAQGVQLADFIDHAIDQLVPEL